MKDTSKRRLLAGRAAIFGAVALALPLTATIVPVFAKDAPATDGADAKPVSHKTKIMVFKGEDGETHKLDISGDEDTPFVKTIVKDGKTIILRSNTEMSDAEVERLVADAELSRAQAEADRGQAEADRGQAEADRGAAEAARAEADAARGMAEARAATVIKFRRHDGNAMSWTDDGAMAAAYIPEIDISEITKNCEDGQPVRTDVTGFDGKNKARVRVVMCGKGQAKLARAHAIQGLREARSEVESDEDIPVKVRKSVLDSLQTQIDKLESQLSTQDAPGDPS